MTVGASAKVRMSPPPPGLMRLINPLVRRVLTAKPLGRHIEAVMLLEFAGQRTGRVIRVPVARHVIDGTVMAVTKRRWRLNFIGGAPVTVTHRGQIQHGHAFLVPATPDQVGAALRTALDNGSSPFILGLKISRRYSPTVTDLAQIGASLVRLELETAQRSDP